MRILFHAINGSGLGHLMRMTTIAGTVRELDGEAHQLLVTNSTHLEPARALGLPVLALPEHEGSPYTGIDRRTHLLPRSTVTAMLRHAITDYDPQTVVLDTHFPASVVTAAAEDGRMLLLVLRRTRTDYLRQLLDGGLLARFDRVVIPHERDDFTAGQPEPLVRRLEAHPGLSFAGPVVRPADPVRGQAVRDRLGVAEDAELAVITCGSGGYRETAARFLTEASRALRLLGRPLHVLAVGGPHGTRPELPPDVHYLPAEPELPSLLTQAEVVIGHAGYNTVHEVAQAGTRAVFVGMPRWQEDQAATTEPFVRQGWASCVPLGAGPERIAGLLGELLDQPRPAPREFAGRWRAAATVLDTGQPAGRFVLGARLPAPASWTRLASAAELDRLPDDRPVTVLIGHAEYASLHNRSAVRVLLDLGAGTPAELGHRAVAALDRDEAGRAKLLLVATVTEDPAALVELAASLGVRGLVLRLPPALATSRPAWVAATLELGRRGFPRLLLDITDAAAPVLAVDDLLSATQRQLGQAGEQAAEPVGRGG